MSEPVIAVADIWRLFEWVHQRRLDRSARDRATVTTWLEDVQRNLRQLSDDWSTICAAAAAGDHEYVRTGSERMLHREVYIAQSGHAAGLMQFYRSLTEVIGSKTTETVRTNLIDALAAILARRNQARSVAERLEYQGAFLDSATRAEHLIRLEEIGDALQREIATLDVLITNFKAAS